MKKKTDWHPMLTTVVLCILVWPLIRSMLMLARARMASASFWERVPKRPVLVTGATGAIGREIVVQLIERGFKVIGLGRRAADLAKLQEEHGEQFSCIIHDLRATERMHDKVARLADGKLAMVFHCAGLSHAGPVFFGEDDASADIVATNVTAPVFLMKDLAPLLDDQSSVFFIGSFLGTKIPGAYYQVYAASKSFISAFAEALHTEACLTKKKPHAEVVLPYYVCSSMSRIRRASLLVPSARTFVRSMLASIGCSFECVPYFPHAVLAGLLDTIPRGLVAYLAAAHIAKIRGKIKKKQA